MKKLDQFILKSFIGPFVAILLVVVFILMMQFLWLYIDELVGKGLSFKIIMEFLGWGCITMLQLSLPLATLLASMMTMGQLGENNELLAIKAAGISLQRMFMPLAVVCLVISIGAFFVSNDLIPVAYNKIYQLRADIGKTKEISPFPENDYTDDGQLLGHIIMGCEMIGEKVRHIPGFPKVLESELKHCILAHHGEYEYGSPKKPALFEAVALNMADNTDAKLEMMTEIFGNTTELGWLGFNRVFESNLRMTKME